MRHLGIPTLVDRVARQAILKVLEPILSTTFSPASHGFCFEYSAHSAWKQAQDHLAAGHEIVADPETFFDRANHDVQMNGGPEDLP